MPVSAINQVPSLTATFPLPVTSQPWGLVLLWGQLTLFHCQLSQQHIPAPCSLSHPGYCPVPSTPSFPSPDWTLRLWSCAGVPVLGCPAGLMVLL